MKTTPLGDTGISVSELCLGTMFFGTKVDAPTSYALLDQYVEAGGSFFDTANIYARWVGDFVGGESESLLGRWMKERGNRQRLFVATKVGFEMPGVDRGLRARQIEEECDKSLRRLGIDTIDLYYAHVDDRGTPLEETLKSFATLIKKGKVRVIGASNYLAWRLEEARWISATENMPAFSCIQQRHSYLRPVPGADFGAQVPSSRELLDFCRHRELSLLAYSPLLGGAYTRDDRPLPEAYSGEENRRRLKVLKEVAREKGATANQLVLSWMLHSDPMALPLVAASEAAQLRENLQAVSFELSREDMERLGV